MIIFVKTLSGKTVTLDVADTDDISSLKQKIAEREGVPQVQQRIVFAGKDLEDSKTLVECGIKKESIVHLVLKASEKNLNLYSSAQKEELEVAQTKVKYYNPSVGLQDELRTYKDSESKFDQHANPQGTEYDLGKDGEFEEFVVLIGDFISHGLTYPIGALTQKGFRVLHVSEEHAFVENLPNADVAWIISGTRPIPHPGAESYPAYRGGKKEEFVAGVLEFHKRGGALFIWGDNFPLFEHANDVLPGLLKSDVELTGNTPGALKLQIGDGNKSGYFSPHIIFTGIISMYEGVTICYPKTLGCLNVLATSTNGHPVICCADNEALKDDTVGRIVVDCGYTKNYCSWDAAGAARYIVNATIWLLGLEHKVLHEIPIAGKYKDPSQFKVECAARVRVHYKSRSERGDVANTATTPYTTPTTPTTPTIPTTSTNYNNINNNNNNYNNNNNNNNNSRDKKPWWRFGF